MPLELEHASYSLPEWQAVKLTLIAPWGGIKSPNQRTFGGVGYEFSQNKTIFSTSRL